MSVPSLIFPPRFSTGDTIGIVAPASPPDKPEVIDEAIARFTGLGFKIKSGKYLRERNGYLAGSDEHRAADVNSFFADPEVKGIFALRGGYGSCRILDLLDYATIRSNPKPFTGYSDITAMQLAILKKSGLVTFHGSNASSAFTEGNIDACRRMLMVEGGGQTPSGGAEVLFSPIGPNGAKLKTLAPGKVKGRLIGGNFTCLLRLIGTPYEPDFNSVILFLEDTCEKAYRIDGMFTHLRLAGILSKIGGMVLGQFDYDADKEEPRRIEECLQREASRLGVPCIAGAPIGHFPEQIVVPQGVEAELDAEGRSLTVRAF